MGLLVVKSITIISHLTSDGTEVWLLIRILVKCQLRGELRNFNKCGHDRYPSRDPSLSREPMDAEDFSL